MNGETRRRGKPAKKYSQAARLHDVIRILEARYGATVDELAEECGVTRRTIYRDLQAISDAGYPLVSEPGVDGRTLHRFVSGFSRIPPVAFSLEELMTLYFCRGQLGFLRGTPFQDDLDAIFGRIRSVLPPRSVAHLERIASAAAPKFLGIRDYAGRKKQLELLRRALLHQYRCRLRYTPPHRDTVAYLFDPYTLLFHKDSLYLGGYAHNREALRLFLVDRVEDVELLDERFEVPEDYRAEDLTGQSFGLIDEGEEFTARVRFSGEIAHLVRERTWHPSQQLRELADGSIELSLTVSGETELLAWLYSYLPHVEVLEPAPLRDRFADGLRCALQKYS
ncbi:transcriptional regulator [Geothermobacter hydrogeniphilus]|uniref:Transcriptional regulator n=1 Tax=Geothermobacter hydrogeniphilus TaxID=1969733 RepID=A0A2K2HC62_9BACT|nr:transcriptional regulator [Geothermobacter hydrogeniphilus]PNU20886.1 transcriptional regulator [Geothermobacter hydrogeniphilus]